MDIINSILVIVLILITGFFVAAEFAIVALKPTKVRELEESGNKNAKYVKIITSRMNDYLAACQLGNTLAALAIGWLGEATMHKWLQPLFDILPLNATVERPVTVAISFLMITYVNVVVGELAPKTLSIQAADKTALFVARPLIIWYYAMYPFNWLLNESANMIARLFGVKRNAEIDNGVTPTELKIILNDSYRQGIVNPMEYQYVQNIFKLDDLQVQEIMIPRKEVEAINAEQTIQELIEMFKIHPFDNYLVVSNNDKDDVQGILHAKTIISQMANDQNIFERTVASLMIDAMKIFEGTHLQDVLQQMRQQQQNFAVVTDEYGGTSGIVTLEDILEVIVGDLDGLNEAGQIRHLAPDHYMIPGDTSLSEVDELLNTELANHLVYTLAGWVLYTNFAITEGESIVEDGYQFTVVSMSQQAIQLVEVKKVKKH